MRNRMKKAFTLVEILIVVVILGILAAIVVPQFTNATQDAQAGNLKTQLSTLQNQIELYKARTNDYPDLSAGWDPLITGDYIKEAPKNPAAKSGVQNVIGTAAADTCGWVYDQATGTLSATYFNEANGVITPTTP
jgi:general secretion pathway protein G